MHQKSRKPLISSCMYIKSGTAKLLRGRRQSGKTEEVVQEMNCGAATTRWMRELLGQITQH